MINNSEKYLSNEAQPLLRRFEVAIDQIFRLPSAVPYPRFGGREDVGRVKVRVRAESDSAQRLACLNVDFDEAIVVPR